MPMSQQENYGSSGGAGSKKKRLGIGQLDSSNKDESYAKPGKPGKPTILCITFSGS